MQFADDFVFVLVEHIRIVDFLEVVEVRFCLVRDAVVHETGTSFKIFDNRRRDVLYTMLVAEVFLLSFDEKVPYLILLDSGVHMSDIRLVDKVLEWLFALEWSHVLVIHVAKNTLLIWDISHSLIKVFDQVMLLVVDLFIIHKWVFSTLNC